MLYSLFSMQLGPLSVGWSLVESPAFRINGEMWCDQRICVALSSKWISWPSKKRTWGFVLLDPQVLEKRLIAFIQPSLSIYPDGVQCTIQSLGRFQ